MVAVKTEGTTLTLTHHVDADVDRVFRVLTEAQALSNWFCPEGFTIPLCEMDARVGGALHIAMRSPEGEMHTVNGIVQELIESSLISYTWRWEEEDGADEHESLVTIKLFSAGPGTNIELTHSLLASAESAERHTTGWLQVMSALTGYLQA